MFEGTRRPTAHRQSRRRIARAAEQACGILAPYLGSRPEPLEPRLLLAHDPVIELRFNEAIDSQTVTDSASAGGVVTGTFAGDILPEIRNTNPSPAGGNYIHFEGDGLYKGAGGRVDLSAMLDPILGRSGSLSYYI